MKFNYSFLAFFLIAVFLLNSNLVSAQPPFQTNTNTNDGLQIFYPLNEVIPRATNYSLHIHVDNISNGKELANSVVDCYIHLYEPTGSHLLEQNLSKDSNLIDHELDILGSNFSVNGFYNWRIYCDDTLGGSVGGAFTVTKTGFLAEGNMEIFIWILFLICVVGNITMLILILVKLATSNETVFGVLSAWAFFTLLLVTNFLGGYLVTTYIENITDLFITIFVWSNGVLPVISLIITMFVKGTQKKKPIPINDFTGATPFRRFVQ